MSVKPIFSLLILTAAIPEFNGRNRNKHLFLRPAQPGHNKLEQRGTSQTAARP